MPGDGFLLLQVLAWFGDDKSLAVQAPEALSAIHALISWTSAIGSILGALCLAFYPLPISLLNTEKETRTLVHCNWGWGGSWNGYYLSGQYDTNSGAVTTKTDGNMSGKDGYYRYELKMHTGIHP